MGGTTAKGWPYVTPDDHPKDFPTHSQALANKLDATIPGKITMGKASANASGIANITFPAGMFTTPPILVATGNTNLALVSASITALSATAATLQVVRTDNNTGYGCEVNWIAIGV